MRVTVWTSVPNHYQDAFFQALRQAGVDLRVNYYDRVGSDRLAMGWSARELLPAGERYVARDLESVKVDRDWKERLHVVPGYGNSFLRRLALRLSHERVAWVHWSESSSPGWRWYASFPLKRWYARLINRWALGAFGIGLTAIQDFQRWGVNSEKIALLTYSNPVLERSECSDSICESFVRGRKAFIFVGSLCRRKGTDLLLDAFAYVAAAADDWVLLLVGPDRSGGAYAKQAKDLEIRDRVLFRGSVRPDQVSTVLRCADVFVLPSRYDGWGVVLNEAASAGLALIGSDRCGASWHLIEPGRNGYRVKAGSVRSLAAALWAYAATPGLAERHGVQSAEIARNYSGEANARRFMTAISSWEALAKRYYACRH